MYLLNSVEFWTWCFVGFTVCRQLCWSSVCQNSSHHDTLRLPWWRRRFCRQHAMTVACFWHSAMLVLGLSNCQNSALWQFTLFADLAKQIRSSVTGNLSILHLIVEQILNFSVVSAATIQNKLMCRASPHLIQTVFYQSGLTGCVYDHQSAMPYRQCLWSSVWCAGNLAKMLK